MFERWLNPRQLLGASVSNSQILNLPQYSLMIRIPLFFPNTLGNPLFLLTIAFILRILQLHPMEQYKVEKAIFLSKEFSFEREGCILNG